MTTTGIEGRIADALARAYDGQSLAELRDEHAALHSEAAASVLAALHGDLEVSTYRVVLLPAGHPMRTFAAVTVRLCESGRWQVDRLGGLYDADGRWETAGRHAGREWRAQREYDLDTAVRLARRVALDVRVDDTTVGALIAQATR